MVLGQAEGTVSVKNQLAFPVQFRKSLGSTFIITNGLEKNLLIVLTQNWKMLLEGTEERTFLDKNTRELNRFLLGNSTEVVLDKKGRFILPDYLKKYAGISKEVVFVGIGYYVEVWDTKKWKDYQEYYSVSIGSIAERLSKEIKRE